MSIDLFRNRGTDIANHLDLHQSFIAIFQEVSSFPGIDTDHTQQELTTKTECHRGLVLADDGADRCLNVGLKDMSLGKFAFEIRT